MDAVSYSLASKQAQRIEKFIENPDSTSGIVTVPKTIASGETVTIPAGRVAVLPNVVVDGILNVEGEVFVPSGATFGDLETQLALKAPLSSPAFTGTPTAPTPTAGDNSTKVATTAYVDGKMVRATAVTASGTSIDFTGIPSWVKRITVMFESVSTNGTSPISIKLGTSSGVESSAYFTTTSVNENAATTQVTTHNTGFVLSPSWTNTYTGIGLVQISLLNQYTWVASANIGFGTTNRLSITSGVKTLSSQLDRIRITTVNGTDTFDAGQINIMYEG